MDNINKDTPPTIVQLVTKDSVIPVETAIEYKRLMEEKGCRCDLYLYEGQEHGFWKINYENTYTATVIKMDRFLESLGYLKGKPSLQNGAMNTDQ